jgi:hypothetical protein
MKATISHHLSDRTLASCWGTHTSPRLSRSWGHKDGAQSFLLYPGPESNHGNHNQRQTRRRSQRRFCRSLMPKTKRSLTWESHCQRPAEGTHVGVASEWADARGWGIKAGQGQGIGPLTALSFSFLFIFLVFLVSIKLKNLNMSLSKCTNNKLQYEWKGFIKSLFYLFVTI